MLLFNILITDKDCYSYEKLSPIIKLNIERAKNIYSEFEYKFFEKNDVEVFLKSNFSEQIFNCYSLLKPYAYKSDLARYCLLYVHGGIYFDLSYYFLKRYLLDKSRPILFRDFGGGISNGNMFFPPKSKFLEKIINKIVINTKERVYGINALCPTGPNLIAKMYDDLSSFDKKELFLKGHSEYLQRDFLQIYPVTKYINQSINKLHCQLVNNDIISIKTKTGGRGLSELGIESGNNYNDFYNRHDIYKLKLFSIRDLKQRIIQAKVVKNKIIKKMKSLLKLLVKVWIKFG